MLQGDEGSMEIEGAQGDWPSLRCESLGNGEEFYDDVERGFYTVVY